VRLDDKALMQLMMKAQDGDRSAYEQLLGLVADFLNYYLASKVFNASFRDDVIQEILLGVHKSRHTYDPKRSFMNWLLAITHFKLTDHIREISKTDQQEQYFEDRDSRSSADLLMDIISSEDEKLLSKCIENLDDRSRQVFMLLKAEGLKVSEVALRLGLSEANVKVICHRALDTIKKTIKDHYEF
jgi:RNA polymerase sigma-70 factor, ECF subfamily